MTAAVDTGSADPSPGSGWCSFETPIGRCRMGWSAKGLTRLCLPEHTPTRAIPRPDDAPVFVREALSRLERYFAGEREDFSGIPLDLDGVEPARQTLYAALCRIGWGETETYGSLAAILGQPGAARAVGRAMGANPIPVIIPCHRILAAGGRMGGFSAPQGLTTKAELLALEGVVPEETRQLGFGF
ncbi:methylated-DNA--[protein]-cysteine S-methyltransferase [Breoghania sp.]|uniref:methylated-DNA--[protein]-cysteine S-methyltransferase n=1 Tax=Breoghania sp. TaxID=2065378 RepID=UPI002AAA6DDA|nr:methylated-DNA--[protein]-cysteine S-methyltransferase [Breoghania sp.]